MPSHTSSGDRQQGFVLATEAFAEVLQGAHVIKVDPSSCIPFISIRKIIQSGVQRLKYSLAEYDGGNVAKGAISGGLLPTVVELTGSFQRYVTDYFLNDQGYSEKDASIEARRKEKWYGVVDGTHRLMALWDLQSRVPEKWGGFQWSVLLLRGVTTIPVLRAFARAQNLRQVDDKLIETTLFDTLHGLQEEALQLQSDLGGRDPTAKELAERYSFSKDRTTSSMRTLAALSLRLTEPVVEAIGSIVNFECPSLASVYYAARGRTQYNSHQIQFQADCRIYRHFINMSSLRQANLFLNDKDSSREEIQILALHRAKECCKSNGFKPSNHRVLNEQYMKAKAARREADKFESLLGTLKWPKGMEKIKENLLRTTELDAEVEENDGNGARILPVILEQYRRVCPHKAPMMEARYVATSVVPTGPDQESRSASQDVGEFFYGNQQSQLAVPSYSRDGVTETRSAKYMTSKQLEEQEEATHGRRAADADKNCELMQQLGITCFRMSWQTYNASHHTATDNMFDLIITEPPRGVATTKPKHRKGVDETISDTEMRSFAAFARRVVAPGGYVILFTPARYFTEWLKALRWNEFSCMEYPFVIMHDERGLQRNNRLLFPQNVSDFAVMACRPGQSATGFRPNLTADYILVPCQYKKKV